MTKEEKEEHLTAAQQMTQLAVIKDRLETYPLANHEVVCIKDCMLLLIRTIAGERIPELDLGRVGGGVMQSNPQAGNSEYINGEMRMGGIEIAPGVMQYPAPKNSAVMDVEAGQRELNHNLEPAKAPLPDMPTPAPGSLMAEALANEGKEIPGRVAPPKIEAPPQSAAEADAIAEIQRQAQGVPDGIPSPSDTKVEITS